MRSKKALKNVIFSLLQQIITVICGFIVPKMIISTYGSNVNGLINSITQFLAYITLLNSGVGMVIKSLLYKPLAEKNNQEIANIFKSSERFFRKIALIFILYIFILCIIYPIFVNDSFGYFYTISLLLIISISTFAEYFFGMTYLLFIQADQKSYVISIIQFTTTIVNSLLIVIMIKLNFNIQLVKLLSALVFVLRPVLQVLYFKKHYKINLKTAKKDYKIKQKWDALAQHIASVIHNNTDVVILTIFSTVLEISVYSIYVLVLSGIKRIIESISSSVEASFGDMYAKKEISILNINFKKYELIYHTISSILFICTMILITPFVSVYTKGINDVNYIRPIFGVIITCAEFAWATRMPYSSITLAAGHFKETQKGAWIEALLNIIISIILVFNFGIIGVAIGTLVAMIIRSIEFMYHSSKYIFKRKQIDSFKWIPLIIIEGFICLLISKNIINIELNNYIEWFKYSIITFFKVSIVVVIINLICNLNTLKLIIKKRSDRIE